MHVDFSHDAGLVEDGLDERTYDKLWDVLDKIRADPEAAPTAGWASYISSRRLWGTHIPGTDYSVYWRIDGDVLYVAQIIKETGGVLY